MAATSPLRFWELPDNQLERIPIFEQETTRFLIKELGWEPDRDQIRKRFQDALDR